MKKGRLLGFISILIWSTHAASGKYILEGGGSPWVLGALRLWFAWIALELIIFFLLRKMNARSFELDRDFWICLGLGFLPNVLFFHFALKYGFAGSVMVLENTAPVFTLLGGVIFLKRWPYLKTVLSIVVAMVGIFLIFVKESSLLEEGVLGASFGLLAGLTWAIFTVWSEKFFRKNLPNLKERLIFLKKIMLYGALVLSPTFLFEPVQFTPMGWWVVIYYAVAPTALASLFWNELVHSISGLSATIIFNLTIPMTFIFAWMTLGEVPTSTHLLAAFLVVTSVMIDALPSRVRTVY